ncbi:MAG: response regulator transcription factor [Lewinellaceae bacterium]|nr:response regulator transcription factor [Lewinellaceae bacterium]
MADNPNREELLSCIAVDDEPRALEVIRLHAAKTPFLNLQRTFRSPVEALAWLKDNPVGLLFLDINMPDVSGLSFRDLAGPSMMIIFTTAYSEYAVESYEQDAVDYLVKPIRYERFLKAALRARERQVAQRPQPPPIPAEAKEEDTMSNSLFIKSGKKHFRLLIDEILYLEKDGNYLWFITPERRLLSRFSTGEALEMLPGEHFMQVHRSYIVALPHIEEVENHQIKTGSHTIPMAKAYREALMARLAGRG